MLQLMSTVFDVEFYFDTHKKIVYIVDRVGEDNGTYFINDLNLKQLSINKYIINDCKDFYEYNDKNPSIPDRAIFIYLNTKFLL